MPGKQSKIAEARRNYNEIKKLRNKVGAKARGKPKTSQVQKDYRLLNREYKKAGQHLGKLTGRKPRKSR